MQLTVIMGFDPEVLLPAVRHITTRALQLAEQRNVLLVCTMHVCYSVVVLECLSVHSLHVVCSLMRRLLHCPVHFKQASCHIIRHSPLITFMYLKYSVSTKKCPPPKYDGIVFKKLGRHQ